MTSEDFEGCWREIKGYPESAKSCSVFVAPPVARRFTAILFSG
jgi:hypothetical protein